MLVTISNGTTEALISVVFAIIYILDLVWHTFSTSEWGVMRDYSNVSEVFFCE